MKRPRLVVIGSSNTDMIVRVPRLPRPGETIAGGRFGTAAGGKGANQAVAAARAGGQVEFVARLGADDLGRAALRAFRRDGIGTRRIVRDQRAPSGVALIFVAEGGENCIAVAGGANERLAAADVRRARPEIAAAQLVLMQLETPLAAVAEAARWAQAQGVSVVLNPAPAQALPDDLLRRVTLLTPNQTEAELLTGIPVNDHAGARQAASALLGRGVGSVVITLGSDGAWVADAATHHHVPGFRVEPVDTTAAGDVFNGALVVALGEGKPLAEAVRFANAAAALSVTKLGAQPSAPTRRQIERFLRQHQPARRAKA